MISEQDRFQIIDFINKIILLWDEFPISVTSWIRSQKRNRLVGGKETSKHLKGLGIDTVLDDSLKADTYKERIREYGLVPVDEGDHIHIQV